MANHEEPVEAEQAQMRTEAMSDHSLLKRYRHGDQEAAAELYRRYAHRLRGLGQAQISRELSRQLDLDDLVQSVFASFFRGANSGCYDVPAGELLWKLLLVIALHKIRARSAFHHAAKRDTRRTLSSGSLDGELEARAGASEGNGPFLRLAVQEALEQLPPLHRQIVTCRLEGYEVAEIALEVERSKRTVERVLQESRQILSSLLE